MISPTVVEFEIFVGIGDDARPDVRVVRGEEVISSFGDEPRIPGLRRRYHIEGGDVGVEDGNGRAFDVAERLI